MPTIIDDQLPGGPQWIENLGHKPVWVEDKSQLKKELEQRNLEPHVTTETTPQPKADDPRFAKDGWRAMQAVVQPKAGGGLIGAAGEVKYVPRSHMQLLSNFAATWGQPAGPSFGIHCHKCGRDVTAKNSPTDAVLSVTCGCSTYVCEAR